jgi:DNA processing protein
MIDLFHLLCLSSISRLGPVRLRALIEAIGSAEGALRLSAKELTSVAGIDRQLADAIAHCRGEAFARDQLQRARLHSARIVTLWDPGYPPLLKTIHDPPILLYIQGTLPQNGVLALALVGTRRPSPYGQAVAERFGRELGRLGIAVVSGLARGIDTIAHRATLDAGGCAIAVVGSGLDVSYPPENRYLQSEIGRRGAVLSELPMGAKPHAAHFPRRNRIISGLSAGCILVESDARGGGMITASCALDQNREVFAVPGTIVDKTSAGTNTLIRDGRAKLIQSIDDVLAEFSLVAGGENTQAPSRSGNGA